MIVGPTDWFANLIGDTLSACIGSYNTTEIGMFADSFDGFVKTQFVSIKTDMDVPERKAAFKKLKPLLTDDDCTNYLLYADSMFDALRLTEYVGGRTVILETSPDFNQRDAKFNMDSKARHKNTGVIREFFLEREFNVVVEGFEPLTWRPHELTGPPTQPGKRD